MNPRIDEVEIEVTEEITEECTCEPFVIVRYRDLRQEPSVVDNVDQIDYWTNDEWLVLNRDEDGETVELFVARQSEVLSVERIG